MYESELTIKEPSKPIIRKIVVALLYSSLFTYTFYLFISKDLWSHPEKWVVLILLTVLLFVLFLSTFLSIAAHSIHLNFHHKKIQHRYRVGLFNYKEVWQDLIDLKYISVFKNGDYYEINMWYEKNQILNLLAVEDYDNAIKHGYLIAEKLNIDLLDARKRGQHKWVNKLVYKTTGVVKYID
jgi:hypothetical protein